MGGRVLRAVGAASLIVGAVLTVSGAAWPAPNLVEVPGTPPGPPVLERLLPGPGHEEPGSGHEESGSGQGECGQAQDEESGSGQGECGQAQDEESGSGQGECGQAQDEESGSGQGECGQAHHEEDEESDDSEAAVDPGSRDAYITRTCERIVGKPGTGGLDKQTNPPAGSDVSPGDKIEVTLTWDPAAWSGASLHKAIDCVTVNGAFAPDLSVEERPTVNDGEFVATYSIPDNVVDGCQVCDQGFLSGDSSGGGFGQERSEPVCFRVVAGTTASGTSPAPVAPAPATPAPAPADVLGEQLVAPVPAPRAAAEVAPVAAVPVPEVLGDTLPRTGQETMRGPLLLAGFGLTVGGLGMVGGNRRPRRVPARTG